MTVGELIEELEDFITEDNSRKHNNLYVCSSCYSECYDGEDIENHTIDAVYPRNGEVVLQSNESDDEWSLRLNYIVHCLKFFNNDTEVVYMDCDDDNNYDFHDTEYCYIDDDDDFVIQCEER